MPRTPQRWRAILTGTATALTLLLPQGAAHAAPPAAPDKIDKIDKALLADLAGKGKTDFLVRLKGGANLAAAHAAPTKAGKAAQVYQAKTALATASQAGLRSLLTARKADFTPLWIANAAKVTGDADLAEEIAALPEVERLEPDIAVQVPEPTAKRAPSAARAKVDGVEWNIDRIGANRVWSEFGARGEGVTVGVIASGVQFDHPAYASRYRGKMADGSLDHSYNWHDTTTCSTHQDGMCHGAGEGATYVLGVMVGGTETQSIGVAPGATWMGVNACEQLCYMSALLAAGQWMLAPTDRAGRHPRPDLAPDIVTSFWRFPSSDSSVNIGFPRWYREVLDAWVAAGIFPVLDNSFNESGACGSAVAPGGFANAYTAGTFGADNAIWQWSTRGPGENGQVKPDIAAPGVDVLTSWPGNNYYVSSSSGYSAAHVAGAVALLWSAAPSLYRDVPATRALLDRTAADVADTSCGGSAQKNNVWGEGRLDVHAAVKAAPTGGTGALTGTVTAGGTPLALVTVTTAAPGARTVVTAADGTYRIPRLAAGTHQVTVRKPGYGTATGTVTVTAGGSAVHDVALSSVPTRTVTGTVTGDGASAAGANVHVVGTADNATTDAAGRYRLTLPDGDHELKVTPASLSPCAGTANARISVTGDMTKDIALPPRADVFGYTCSTGTEPWIAGTHKVTPPAQWVPPAVDVPFSFPFYRGSHGRIWPSMTGYVGFTPDGDTPWNDNLPSFQLQRPAILPFWDDLWLDDQAGIYTTAMGTAPRRTFVVEWRNVTFRGDRTKRVSFAALLHEDGSIGFRYRGTSPGLSEGSSATIGIQGGFTDNSAIEYASHRSALADGRSVTFTPTGRGLLSGTVLNANDSTPVGGATVKVGDVATLTTAGDGTFTGLIPPGEYQVTVSKERYGTVSRQAAVRIGERSNADVSLVTGRVSADTTAVELVARGGEPAASATFTLTNLGKAAAPYSVEADAVGGWLSVSPGSGDLAPGASAVVTVTGSAAGLAAGTFRNGRLIVRSASAGTPVFHIPASVVAPKTEIAVDAGGIRDTRDAAGHRWSADRAYSAGGYGYLGDQSRTHTATGPIRGTADQELCKTARESMLEYRFDGLPTGVYTVELGFAETRDTRPGQRIFTVTAEGRLAVPGLDVAAEAGVRTATTRRYAVKVTDGRLNLRFVGQRGTPLVNTIRVTERPDKTLP
ncbi:Carboxypeptidase regulatory-like domain-containing protein [Sinosporangium album]|uniref:alpha-amylase n=1 Tax=Sinosporangium album TaxID=504805 RepID=A0A1G7QP53_9ACTN|nr:carboxypeptidase regulatory-like domain-containing protein [Sinosporangium album]SDG00295.1 Carboxypeptidase regulatory-like domain-containing protein [Sinosporangium album]